MTPQPPAASSRWLLRLTGQVGLGSSWRQLGKRRLGCPGVSMSGPQAADVLGSSACSRGQNVEGQAALA